MLLEDGWNTAEVEKIVATLGGRTLRQTTGPTTNEYFLLFLRTLGLPTSRDHANPRSGHPSALASLNPASVVGDTQTDATDADT